MLEQIKDDVIRIALQAQREGLCRFKAGNMSIKDEETGLVVITPSGIDREMLKTDDMIVIDENACVVENITGLKPSSEVLMHLEVYRVRPDVRAVVHTHSPFAKVMACLNKPIPAFSFEIFHVNAENQSVIPVAPYARPGTKDLGKSVADAVKKSDAVLLQAHGVLAVDAVDIDGAFIKACYIEDLARDYYHCLSATGGKEPWVLPTEELQNWAYPQEITFRACS